VTEDASNVASSIASQPNATHPSTKIRRSHWPFPQRRRPTRTRTVTGVQWVPHRWCRGRPMRP